jgi:hypothetical protein
VDCASAALPKARELAQLSTLRSLQEVRVVWDSCGVRAATVEGITAAFQVLPLTALSWQHAGIPAAAMQQLGSLQGLTALQLSNEAVVSPAQLAVVVRQLTALQRLHLTDGNYIAGSIKQFRY